MGFNSGFKGLILVAAELLSSSPHTDQFLSPSQGTGRYLSTVRARTWPLTSI